MKSKKNICAMLLWGAIAFENPAPSEIKVRIGDLVDIRGVRNNQLNGLGLVVGLNGTGDQQAATKQIIANYLRVHNLNVSVSDVNVGNVAMVSVTATLEPFKSNGARIDVTVSAMEAKSLSGGTLLMTPLIGADGEVYALAQGALSLGGGYEGKGAAASATKGHLTVATIPNGAIVEKEVPMQMVNEGGILKFDLRIADFHTARRIGEAIHRAFPDTANVKNAGEVWIQVPTDLREGSDLVSFISTINEMEVVPDSPAIVVINERTGTLVSGEHVRIRAAGIAHGPLTITIAETPQVSQPNPLGDGTTTTVPRTEVVVDEKKYKAEAFPGAVSVSQLVNALNALQVTPRDVIAILQALKKAGSLHAELVIM